MKMLGALVLKLNKQLKVNEIFFKRMKNLISKATAFIISNSVNLILNFEV